MTKLRKEFEKKYKDKLYIDFDNTKLRKTQESIDRMYIEFLEKEVNKSRYGEQLVFKI